MKRFKQWLVVAHLYVGLLLCLLFVAWFVSGVAMVYYRTPVLDESQRISFASSLTRVQLQAASAPQFVPVLAARWSEAEFQNLRLALFGERPLLRWRTAADGWRAAWTDSGEVVTFDEQSLKHEALRWFGSAPELHYLGALEANNQWSYFSALKSHYPLHRFASSTGFGADEVLFSSRTGEPVVATTFGSRLLYYLGPGLHYWSFYPIRNNDPLWRGIVNWSSGIGAATCFVGIVSGVWQLRWRLLFGARRAIPYRKQWMRWHHWTGLWFGLFAFTFVLSGLFSMNPGKIFPSSQIPAAIANAWLGHQPALDRLASPRDLALALPGDMMPKEIEWRRLQGEPLVLAHYDKRQLQLIRQIGGVWREQSGIADNELVSRLATTLPARIANVDRMESFDDYYYARKGNYLPLPVLRIQLADTNATALYLDPASGRLISKSDNGTRARRWLFNALHSFDLPALTKSEPLWQGLIWALSLAGLAVSVTSTVIAWQWLRRWYARRVRYA